MTAEELFSPAELFQVDGDLARVARELNVTSSSVFADVACGDGVFSLTIAGMTGARVHGIDPYPESIWTARSQVTAYGLAGRAQFQVGDWTETDLPARSMDAALAVHSVHLARDISAAFREVARILQPGGRFVFTTFEGRYGALLAQCGFDVSICGEATRSSGLLYVSSRR